MSVIFFAGVNAVAAYFFKVKVYCLFIAIAVARLFVNMAVALLFISCILIKVVRNATSLTRNSVFEKL